MRVAAVVAHTFASESISQRISRILLTAVVLMGATLSLLAQTITVTPATLTFANQATGTTSAAKVVTVANKGAAAQAVVLPAGTGFTETDNWNGNIAAA